MHARQRASAPDLPDRHWHSPWSHECVPSPASESWTRPNAGAIICSHSWLTRWGAPADNNLPVIAAVAPVPLNNSAVLPLVCLRAKPPRPSRPGCVAPLHQFVVTKRLFGKRSASGRRLQAGERWASREPARAVHKLVLWAGGLSTAGACSQAVVKSTPNSFDGSISMSKGGSVSVSAKVCTR